MSARKKQSPSAQAGGARLTVRHPSAAHQGAVLDAEVRRIARELRWCGPLKRAQLERLCGARHWHEGGFDQAVRRGLAAGELRKLPFDYLAVAREVWSSTRPDPP